MSSVEPHTENKIKEVWPRGKDCRLLRCSSQHLWVQLMQSCGGCCSWFQRGTLDQNTAELGPLWKARLACAPHCSYHPTATRAGEVLTSKQGLRAAVSMLQSVCIQEGKSLITLPLSGQRGKINSAPLKSIPERIRHIHIKGSSLHSAASQGIGAAEQCRT